MQWSALVLGFYATTLMFMMLNPTFSVMDYVVQVSAILLAFSATVALNLNHVWMAYMHFVLTINMLLPLMFTH